MDQILTITVFGQPFRFKTDLEGSEAKAVADYFTEALTKVQHQGAEKVVLLDKRAMLILTALNIANELFELKQKHEKLLLDISARSETMLNALAHGI